MNSPCLFALTVLLACIKQSSTTFCKSSLGKTIPSALDCERSGLPRFCNQYKESPRSTPIAPMAPSASAPSAPGAPSAPASAATAPSAPLVPSAIVPSAPRGPSAPTTAPMKVDPLVLFQLLPRRRYRLPPLVLCQLPRHPWTRLRSNCPTKPKLPSFSLPQLAKYLSQPRRPICVGPRSQGSGARQDLVLCHFGRQGAFYQGAFYQDVPV
jgi:hypothetical protein